MKITGLWFLQEVFILLTTNYSICTLGVMICKIFLASLSMNIDRWHAIKVKWRCLNEYSDHFVSRLLFEMYCGFILWYHRSDSFCNRALVTITLDMRLLQWLDLNIPWLLLKYLMILKELSCLKFFSSKAQCKPKGPILCTCSKSYISLKIVVSCWSP